MINFAGRIGYGMAIILSYPIMLYELRHIVDLLAFGERKQTASQNTATTRCADTARMLLLNVVIIAPCVSPPLPPHVDSRDVAERSNLLHLHLQAMVALYVENVDVVFGLIGSTMSPAIIFIMPAAFYLKLQKQLSLEESAGEM